ncbi:MAG: hypothetical protein APF77_19910 [Clostridia bacterium BRH_c25]|nr:MAG: hypothetical protein APF77_19910 [Clostridia bacterium BRH_c25]
MSQNNIVSFNNILVNAINNNSGIFVGTNSQGNWNSNSNNKSGFGSVFGARNVVSRAVNIFMDNDLIDTPIINGAGLPLSAKGKDNITIYGCNRNKKE